MSADRRTDDGLNDQLVAFGRTLERTTREPIAAPGVLLPTQKPHARRRSTVAVGIAACLAAVLGGLAWIATTQDDVDVEPVPGATGPVPTKSSSTDVTTVPPNSLPLLSLDETIPEDPLGLVSTGRWILEERVEEPWSGPPASDCPAFGLLSEFDGRRTIRERYSRHPRFVGLDVTFLDADTVDGASLAIDAFDQLRSCDTMAEGTDLPALSTPLPDGTSVRGFRIGEEFAIIAVGGDGNLVIALELEDQGVTDTLINDLVTRAAALLAERPAVEPVEPVTSPSNASVPTSNSD